MTVDQTEHAPILQKKKLRNFSLTTMHQFFEKKPTI